MSDQTDWMVCHVTGAEKFNNFDIHETQWARVVTPNTRDASSIIALLPHRPRLRTDRTETTIVDPRPHRGGEYGGVLLPPPFSRPHRLMTVTVLAISAALVAPLTTAAPIVRAAGATTRWAWPVDAPRSILRSYLAPATPYGSGHRGIDIAPASGAGSPVYSPAEGIVHFAGTVVDRPVLSIRHPGGLISSFEPVSTGLLVGESIRRGQIVGALEAGHCSAACLHFGVRLDGEYVSPLNYLGGIPPSVLLPTRRLSGPGP